MSSNNPMNFTIETLAPYFDHTALKPETTARDIEKLCGEADEYGMATVCVNPVWIPLAAKLLSASPVAPITVVGFPLGATGTLTKVYEARHAIDQGAKEIDMVLSVGELKSGDHDAVRADIGAVKRACGDIPLKVIFETSLLTADEIRMVARWCAEDSVDFVKTSTGFGSRGAGVDDIAIMREAIASVSGSMTRIKASGGIRDLKTTLRMIEAGADRIGASASVQILREISGDMPARPVSDY
jgi:deoxyribose-phosphate aldolase